MFGQHRRPRAAPGGARTGTVDPARVLRRRRSPLVFALGGVLVGLMLVVEVLILQAYVSVNRTTAIFSQESYVTGNLVNVQREALLLNVKIEELPSHPRRPWDKGPPGAAGQPADPAAQPGRRRPAGGRDRRRGRPGPGA